jgi:hypothetical protein
MNEEKQDRSNDAVLVVHNQSNYETSDKARAGTNAIDVTIWGGDCFNCGEDSVSTLIHSQREHLSRFIYLPTRHKGGRMVRPHYYRSDRLSTMSFPSLKTLGYYQDCGTPLDALWIVPNLETLYVFEGGRRRPILDRWSVEPGDGTNLPQRVLEECPNLREIICAKPDFSEPFQFQTLRRLMPPHPLAWDCLRLLEVVLKKEDRDTCPMAMLPGAAVDRIVSFCHRGHWKTLDYNGDGNVAGDDDHAGDEE